MRTLRKIVRRGESGRKREELIFAGPGEGRTVPVLDEQGVFETRGRVVVRLYVFLSSALY